MRTFRTLVLALSLAVPVSASMGCGPKLDEVAIPTGGVVLEYDLTPGQVYTGSVRRGEKIKSDFAEMNRSIRCDIQLTVRGEDDKRGGTQISAKITNVDLKWTLPPSAPFSPDEFLQKALSVVQGMEFEFNVDDDGTIIYMPEVSELGDLPQDLAVVIDQVFDAVRAAFVKLPEDSLAAGESWSDKVKKGREGKLGSYRRGETQHTLVGLFVDPSAPDNTMAKLNSDRSEVEIVTTKAGSHRTEWSGKTTAMFSTSHNYLKSIDSELRRFDPTSGTTFTKVSVEWNKGPLTSGPAPAPKKALPAGVDEVQTITDPCNFEYVGPEECKEETAEEAAAYEAAAARSAASAKEGTAAPSEPAAEAPKSDASKKAEPKTHVAPAPMPKP